MAARKRGPHLTHDQRLAFEYATKVLGWRAKVEQDEAGAPVKVTYWTDLPKVGEVLVADHRWDPLGAPFGDVWHGIRGVFLAEESLAPEKRVRYSKALKQALGGTTQIEPTPWDYIHASPRQRITALVALAREEESAQKQAPAAPTPRRRGRGKPRIGV
jgi:hypothetical protein